MTRTAKAERFRVLDSPVKWKEENGGISQVYSTGLEYAFCSPKLEQIMPFVYCKDFLQDLLQTHHNKTSCSIYGFTYNHTSTAPSLSRLRLLIANKSDAGFAEKLEKMEDFVHQLETAMHMPSKTIVFMCKNPPKKYAKSGVALLSASRHWLLAPPMISLYTLAIRTGFVHEAGRPYMDTVKGMIEGKVKSYQSSDGSFWKSALPGVEKLIRSGFRNVFGLDAKENYPGDVSVSTMHNNLGIVGFASNYPKSRFPRWYNEVVAK